MRTIIIILFLTTAPFIVNGQDCRGEFSELMKKISSENTTAYDINYYLSKSGIDSTKRKTISHGRYIRSGKRQLVTNGNITTVSNNDVITVIDKTRKRIIISSKQESKNVEKSMFEELSNYEKKIKSVTCEKAASGNKFTIVLLPGVSNLKYYELTVDSKQQIKNIKIFYNISAGDETSKLGSVQKMEIEFIPLRLTKKDIEAELSFEKIFVLNNGKLKTTPKYYGYEISAQN